MGQNRPQKPVNNHTKARSCSDAIRENFHLREHLPPCAINLTLCPSPCNQGEEEPILKTLCMKIALTETCQNCLPLLNTDKAEPDTALLAPTAVIVFPCQEKALNNVFQLNHNCHLYYVYLPDFNI